MANTTRGGERRGTDRRAGGSGYYFGPERRKNGDRRDQVDRRAPVRAPREPINKWLAALMLVVAMIVIDIYFFDSHYRHWLQGDVNDTAASVRAWSNSLWGA